MASPLLPGTIWQPPGYRPPDAWPFGYRPPEAWPSASPGTASPATPPAPPAAAAPLSLPSLPPGYVYVPHALPPSVASPQDAARQEQLYASLERIEQRLETLKRKRVSLGGPIAVMVLGYGTMLISTAVALGSFGFAEQIERGDSLDDGRLDVNDDGVVDGDDERHFRKAARISSVIGGLGMVVGLSGTSRLVHNVGLRRERAQEESLLKEQHRYTRARLGYGASAVPGGMQLGIQGSF